MPSSCSNRPKLNATSNNDTARAEMNAAAAADRKQVKNLSSRTIANAADNIETEEQLVCEDKDPSIRGMNNQLIASMLGFLNYRDIMRSRICCSKFRDAAKSTIVPWANDTWKRRRDTKFTVESVRAYKAMVTMSEALPKLQQLDIRNIGKNKYRDGNDPIEEEATRTASWTVYDIQMISNFRELRELDVSSSRLNGKYPFLFEFPLLEVLRINCCM